jgi:hypothetical protein
MKPDAAVAAGAEGNPKSAPAPAVSTPPPPAPTLHAEIDLSKQRMTVKEHGKVKHTWPISSGRDGYHTPTGSFRPSWMAKMWYSKQYDDAPMPNSVFFNGGIAVHATQATGLLGRPASHGCVRLSPANAATFYALVAQHGKSMTRIKVFGTTPVTAVAARRPSQDAVSGRAAGRMPQRYGRYDADRGYRPYYAPPRYSAYGGGYGSFGGGSPRYVYPGDPLPYGYRPARPLYRPYGAPRVYYVD